MRYTIALPLDHLSLAPYRVRIEERTITANKAGKTRTITHLHYINWPDRNEAPDLTALELLMNRQEALSEKSSISIHCQGGVGRTLSYALAIWLRKEIREATKRGEHLPSKQFNLPEMTYALKLQAPRLGSSPKGELFALIFGR